MTMAMDGTAPAEGWTLPDSENTTEKKIAAANLSQLSFFSKDGDAYMEIPTHPKLALIVAESMKELGLGGNFDGHLPQGARVPTAIIKLTKDAVEHLVENGVKSPVLNILAGKTQSSHVERAGRG